MPGVAIADTVIVRGRRVAAGVAGYRARHTLHVLKDGLNAPEAAAREDRDLIALRAAARGPEKHRHRCDAVNELAKHDVTSLGPVVAPTFGNRRARGPLGVPCAQLSSAQGLMKRRIRSAGRA